MCRTECLLAIVALSIGLVNSWGEYPKISWYATFWHVLFYTDNYVIGYIGGMIDDFRSRVHTGFFIQECGISRVSIKPLIAWQSAP